MKVGIIQSNYLPWRGYFDFIDSVDLFVILDDVQFTARDWRNRNRIKTHNGLQWLTVPVHYRRHEAQRICETAIDHSRNWQRDHFQSVALNYARAPHVLEVLAILHAAFDAKPATISELNVALMTSLCGYLRITTPLRFSAEFGANGVKTERLIAILQSVGATTYVSGPGAKAYLDESQFRQAGIRLEWKTYSYPDYPQLWGPFEGAVSVIDLIANCGPEARLLLKAQASNDLAAAA